MNAAAVPYRDEVRAKGLQTIVQSQPDMLIETPQMLDVDEQHLILYISGTLSPNTPGRHVRLFTKELADIFNAPVDGFFKRVKMVITRLQHKSLLIRDIADKTEIFTNWISAATFHEESGFIEVEIPSNTIPHLYHLREQASVFQLWNSLQLKSRYSVRIYEMLKNMELNEENNVYLTYEEFRNLMSVPSHKLNHFGHFKKTILEKSRTELLRRTDLQFEYEIIKENNRITGLRIGWKKNRDLVDELLDEDGDFTIYHLLVRFNITPKDASLLLRRHGEDALRTKTKEFMQQENLHFGSVDFANRLKEHLSIKPTTA